MRWFKRLLTEQEAQDLAEYGVALAIIGVGAGAMAVALSQGVADVWASANAAIQSATDIIAGS
jgi:Flp pilus assembly pilin Flp